MKAFRSIEAERGAISAGLATVLAVVPLAAASTLQDWYVDVNALLCPGGIGTQARPFCDVMDAVAVAANGDTIHIAPGTYFENVVLDKDLNLIGTGGEQVTIVDGMANGSVMQVYSVTTVTGLQLTNGSGTPICHGCGTGGGGIFSHGSLTLVESTVVGNTADAGGGLLVSGPLTLLNSSVVNNLSPYGIGGIYQVFDAQGDLTLVDSGVDGNVGRWGGAITTVGNRDDSVTLLNSSVSGNEPYGMLIDGGGATVMNCTVSNNTRGGIVASYSDLALADSTVSGNGGTGLLTGGEGARVTLANTTVSNNSGVGLMVGLRVYVSGYGYGYYPADAVITNSTIASNSSGGLLVEGWLTEASSAMVENSILWGNGASSIQLVGSAASSTVDYALVEGGWPGTGNIAGDPLFADPLNGDFRLLPGSPCIDAGNNMAVPLGLFADLAGKRRFIDDPATPDTGRPGRLWPVVDMGAHEFGNDPPRKVRQR